MKYLSESAYEYMDRIWDFSNSSKVDDMTMFWESDYPELTAKRLVDAGAVEPNCPEAKEMIAVAESITAEWENSVVTALCETYTIVECRLCSHVHFIPPYCEPLDWIDGSCDGCGKPGCQRVA